MAMPPQFAKKGAASGGGAFTITDAASLKKARAAAAKMPPGPAKVKVLALIAKKAAALKL